ncbi:MAG TPA: cytochrome c oxidase subunit 3 family protein [Thermoanaerobaculia bacterium]|nr:cytochrome c oxidase subunit 3 family protein [Thermoanaerobaculia bacterium]
MPSNPTLYDLEHPGHGEADAHPHHHPFLQHHFEDLGQQHEASTLGMWFFVAQEILFFGGIFCAYFIYREMYPHAWKAASHLQNWKIGFANTVVLIGSSLTMALAVWGAQGARRKFTTLMLVLTLILGAVFVGVKGYEYHMHIEEGLFPGAHFTYVHHEDVSLTRGIEMFMTFYFTMTGLHALHMIIGAGLLLWFIRRSWRGDFGPEYYGPVEIMGLYWHFVDIVWIFLFPLLYLV